MKIVAMSDWDASNPNEVVSALEKLEPDCFIYAGDGLRTMSQETVERVRDLTTQKSFLYVKGNHDFGLSAWWSELEGVQCLHNKRVTVRGVSFTGYSGISNKQGISHFHHNSWVLCEEKELQADLFSLLGSKEGPTVLVTHMPPYKILDYSLAAGHNGSKALKKVVEQTSPFLHIFGHIHFLGGGKKQHKSTACINVASYEKGDSSARITIIDTEHEDSFGIQVQAVPESMSGDLLARYNAARASTVEELDKKAKIKCYAKSASHSLECYREELTTRRGNRLKYILEEIVGHKITSKVAQEIQRLESSPFTRVSLRNYFLNECNPWPKSLTPRLMLDLFYSQVSPVNEGDYSALMRGGGATSRNALRKLILDRISRETGRYSIDVEAVHRLPVLNSTYFSAKWIPSSNRVLAACLSTSEGIVRMKNEITPHKIEQRVAQEQGGPIVCFGRVYKSFFDFDEVKDLAYLLSEVVGLGIDRKDIITLNKIAQLILGEEVSYDPEFILDSDVKRIIGDAVHFFDCMDKNFLLSFLTECCSNEVALIRDGCRALRFTSKLPKEHFVLCRFDFENSKVHIQD